MERRVSHSDIQNWFTYHSPHERQIPAYAAIRDAGKQLATVILALTPSGPDQTVAIRKVREAVMTANQAIACDNAPEEGLSNARTTEAVQPPFASSGMGEDPRTPADRRARY